MRCSPLGVVEFEGGVPDSALFVDVFLFYVAGC